MINFFKQIFIWWHKQTFGTFLYTLFTGKYVGEDEFGNKYYTNSKKKRWVVYNSKVESSKIPPKWHLWIHHMTNNKPNEDVKEFEWQIPHKENLTGTKNAFKPDGSLSSEHKKNNKKYETWKA